MSNTLDKINFLINKIKNNEPLLENDKDIIINELEKRKAYINQQLSMYQTDKDRRIKNQKDYYHNIFKNDDEKMRKKREYNREYSKRKYQEKKSTKENE